MVKIFLNQVDPKFADNIEFHTKNVTHCDVFHISANTDSKRDCSKVSQEQDSGMLLHVVKKVDAGIVVRGAKFESAAVYANQAFSKPTIANWGNDQLSNYAIGFICDFNSLGLKFIYCFGFDEGSELCTSPKKKITHWCINLMK